MRTTSRNGLEQVIELFERPQQKQQLGVSVQKPEDAEALLDNDKVKYAESVYLPDWREIVLVLSKEKPIDLQNLELLATTSYHSQAVRKGKADDIIPAYTEGLILTADGKFVYGVRGGNSERGKACIAPAGALTSHYDDHPLFDGLAMELEEELGVSAENPVCLGYQTDPDFTKGANFVFYARIKETSDELVAKHAQAYSIYQQAMAAGTPEVQARKAIPAAGHKNIDAWEHSQLLFVDPNGIGEIIDSRCIRQGDQEYQLLDIGRGPLIMYKEMKEML